MYIYSLNFSWKGTLLEISVDLAAQYCKKLQYNTTFIYYSKIL